MTDKEQSARHRGSTCTWVVDGVSREAQEAAQAGAEREGTSLGEWTQAVILKAAEARSGRDAPEIANDHRPGRRYF